MKSTPKQELALRIMNFVMPYLPEYIKDEAMNIIMRYGEKEEKKEEEKHNYAHTKIRWKDDGSESDVIICINWELGKDLSVEDDAKVFFFCDGEKSFENLKHEDNGEDFVVVGCTLFTESL